jgi:hypothetical protein
MPSCARRPQEPVRVITINAGNDQLKNLQREGRRARTERLVCLLQTWRCISPHAPAQVDRILRSFVNKQTGSSGSIRFATIFGHHDRTSPLRSLGRLTIESSLVLKHTGPKDRSQDRRKRNEWGEWRELNRLAVFKTLNRFAVLGKENDHDSACPRQTDVAERCLGNVRHSGSHLVPLAVQGRGASRLSGGPSYPVSQRGGRRLA